MPTDKDVENTPRTVGDRTQYSTAGLPHDLRHRKIYGYRDMGTTMREAYQIIFDQSWMPYKYDIPEGWEMHHARTEWEHRPGTPWPLRLLSRGKARLCIVVSEESDLHV